MTVTHGSRRTAGADGRTGSMHRNHWQSWHVVSWCMLRAWLAIAILTVLGLTLCAGPKSTSSVFQICPTVPTRIPLKGLLQLRGGDASIPSRKKRSSHPKHTKGVVPIDTSDAAPDEDEIRRELDVVLQGMKALTRSSPLQHSYSSPSCCMLCVAESSMHRTYRRINVCFARLHNALRI